MSGGIEIVARRWDGIGGRLNSLANGVTLASIYGFRCRLAWPATPEIAAGDPHEIFASTFLEAHLIDEAELAERPSVECLDVADGCRRRSELIAGGCIGDPFLEVDLPLGVHSGIAADGEEARQPFADAWATIEWADSLAPVLDLCTHWPRDRRWVGVHVRAGDIVTGAWSRTLWHEKYQVAAYLRAAIEHCDAQYERVLIVTDHPEFAVWLANGLASTCTPGDLLPAYASTTELQRGVADLLLLSQCSAIVGPPNSAFSGLAATLAGVEVVQPYDFVEMGTERQFLEAGIAAQLVDTGHSALLAPVTARDIVWYLDAFGAQLPAARVADLASTAAELDPDFTGAWARLARASARCGRGRDAKLAAAMAQETAATDDRQDDTAFDAAAATTVVACMAALRPRWLSFGSAARRRQIAGAEAAIEHCAVLRPWHPLSGALTGLKELALLTSEVVALPWRRRASVTRALRRELERPPTTGDGLSRIDLIRSGPFDWVSAEVDGLIAEMSTAMEAFGFRPGSPRGRIKAQS